MLYPCFYARSIADGYSWFRISAISLLFLCISSYELHLLALTPLLITHGSGFCHSAVSRCCSALMREPPTLAYLDMLEKQI
jgi:hypothetical protein